MAPLRVAACLFAPLIFLPWAGMAWSKCLAFAWITGSAPDAAMRAAAAGLPLTPETARVAPPTSRQLRAAQHGAGSGIVAVFGGPAMAKGPPAQTPYPAVFKAIERRDYRAYLAALPQERGARDVLVRGGAGYDPLGHAVAAGAPDIVRDLIARGAPVRDDGRLPAPDGGRPYIARAVKAWEDARHVRDFNPKIAVPGAEKRYRAIAELLIRDGADPDGRLPDQQTALDLLVFEKSHDAVDLTVLLLQHGATLEARAGQGQRSPLYWAIYHGNLDLARAMLRYGRLSSKLIDEAFYGALNSNQPALAIELLDRGANPNLIPADYGFGNLPSPIQHAVSPVVRSRALVQALIRHHVNPNVVLSDGMTPLMHVVHDYELMQGLLDLGANPDARGASGDTALHRATLVPNPDVVRRGPEHLAFGELLSDPETRRRSVELLLKYGADPNVRNASGYTPLMQTSFADGATIELLLHAGGKVFTDPPRWVAAYPQPIGPVSWALVHWNETLATALVIQTRKLDEFDCAAVYYAAVTNVESALSALLDLGGQTQRIEDSNGQTPLIAAASQGNLEAVRLLLDRGAAKVDELSTRRPAASAYELLMGVGAPYTALEAASAAGKTEVVRLLLDRGANPKRLKRSAAMPH